MDPAPSRSLTPRVITTVMQVPTVVAPPKYNGITVLAGFKLVKGALVCLVATGALELRGHGMEEIITFLVNHFHMSTESRLVRYLWDHFDTITDGKLRVIGSAGLVYGMLELLESYGLFMRRHWAELLTIIATSLPVPIELYEIWDHATVSRVGVLVFNLAIVGYLYARRRGFLTRKQRKVLNAAQHEALTGPAPEAPTSPSA